MQSFRDSKDRKWEIDLNFGSIKRLKKESDGKFDLLDDGKGNIGQLLWTDLGELYEVLWLLVEPQAQKLNPPVTAEEFGESMAAACIIDARQKFFTEYIDFFRHLQRPQMATVLEKMMSLNAKASNLTMAKLEVAMGADFDKRAEAKIEEAVSLAFGSFQESLDSIPTPTPGGNST